MSVTVKATEDPSTKGKRFVIGDRRMVLGSLVQPQNKYVTGGFEVTPQELGFDKTINQLKVFFDKALKAFPVAEKLANGNYKLKFFSAVATEVANEAETMKEIEVPFEAIGE